MSLFLLQCLYFLLLACATLIAYLFPEISEQLFYRLPRSEQLQMMYGPPEAYRYRFMMWLAGSAAVPVFAAMLARWGLDVGPARQPRKLMGLGWLFFAGAAILLAGSWLIFFVMIFVGPTWVQFEPLYALMLTGLFAFINTIVHLLMLKLRPV